MSDEHCSFVRKEALRLPRNSSISPPMALLPIMTEDPPVDLPPAESFRMSSLLGLTVSGRNDWPASMPLLAIAVHSTLVSLNPTTTAASAKRASFPVSRVRLPPSMGAVSLNDCPTAEKEAGARRTKVAEMNDPYVRPGVVKVLYLYCQRTNGPCQKEWKHP